ncbi:MAG TPA: 3-oxoacid CoA-transferase subunit A [Dehalococcoidia bacterium]|nr:3-oxoacid CoA-transferase subunit A [Dehalococcoidia bacterium]
MIDKVYPSPAAAIEDVFDGATIMIGGFASAGTPTELILALCEQGTRDLTAIANNIGLGDKLDTLCEKRQIKRLVASFAIRPSAKHRSRFQSLYEAGEVELEVVPQGTLAERIRAGGAGIPAFYTPTGVGTVISEGKETREFDGRRYLMERALTADFAFVRAYKGDRLGNLIYRKAGRNFNEPMAMAAKVTIAEVEEIVEPGELDPEHVVTPGIFVQRIVQAPSHDVRWFN